MYGGLISLSFFPCRTPSLPSTDCGDSDGDRDGGGGGGGDEFVREMVVLAALPSLRHRLWRDCLLPPPSVESSVGLGLFRASSVDLLISSVGGFMLMRDAEGRKKEFKQGHTNNKAKAA